jgi:large subunit ribosomal protein L4
VGESTRGKTEVELQVKNLAGEVTGTIAVRDDVFGAELNPALIHQVMVGQLANRRQGTAKTKTRAEVAGGGAKPRPQKHTGRARAGSIRSPIWRGGGVTFGPRPRSYRHNTPKQMRRGALLSALSGKAQEGSLVVVEDFDISEPKTKAVAQVLRSLGTVPTVLLVADGASEATLRAARNVPRLKMKPSRTLSAVDLLSNRTVVMTVEAVRNAEAVFGGRFERKPSENAEPAAELVGVEE